MPDRIEQQILDGFRALRDVSPPESASASAVRRAMESVRADQHAPSIRLLRPSRWIFRGSIAAGILLAAGLVWMSQSAREVSAAELLQQVIQTTDAYRGWIHIITERGGRLPDPIKSVYPGFHLNKADGTFIVTGPVRIEMNTPSRKETAEYDSRTNEIRLGDMMPYNVGSIQQLTERMPIDVNSELAGFRRAAGREPLEVTRDRESDQERIRIRYFKDTDDAAATLQPIADYGSLPVETTLWIDPRTKLIRRRTTSYVTRFGENDIRPTTQPHTDHWFYDQPIPDIYAAGAPRDAKIKDFRVTGKAKEIWTRLEKRHEEAYGDGIAVVTTAEFLPDGRLDPNHGTVTIYLRQGAATFFADYYVSPKPGYKGQPRIPPFADWPAPDPQEVLRRARLASPGMVFVTDGSRAWGGDVSLARWLDAKHMVWWDGEMGYSVSRNIWPTRWGMSLYGTSTSMEMSRDSVHPQWLLLHSRQARIEIGEATESGLSREVLHWLDTSRDDMPIRRITRDYALDGQTVEREYEYLFEDWAQLDNGQWYPTRWRQVSRVNKEGTLAVENTFENRLRIYFGAAIDSQWFTMPPVFPSAAGGPSAGNGS